jgi:putative transposase
MSNSLKYKKQSRRLKGFDYGSEGAYLIKINTRKGKHLFGSLKNGKMLLNVFGEIAKEEWLNTLKIRKNVALGAFSIQPDHIYAIIIIYYSVKKNTNIGKFISPSQTLGAIVRGYKGAVTKAVKKYIYGNNKHQFFLQLSNNELHFSFSDKPDISGLYRDIKLSKSVFQKDYYDFIIQNEEDYFRITENIWQQSVTAKNS